MTVRTIGMSYEVIRRKAECEQVGTLVGSQALLHDGLHGKLGEQLVLER